MDLSRLSDEELMKLYQQEQQQAQQSLSQMSDAELMAAYQKEQESQDAFNLANIGKSYAAAGEFLGTGVTGALSGLASYPYGAYVTATEGEKAGEEARKAFREAGTYTPRTEYGQRLQQNIGEFMQPVMPYLERGTKAIGESAKGAFAPLGETTSETAGYMMKNLPMALLDFFGVKGMQNAISKNTLLKDEAGRPTKTLRAALRKQGIEYDSLPIEAQASIPATIKELPLLGRGQKDIAGEVARGEMRAGSQQGGLAEKMTDQGGIIRRSLVGGEKIIEDPLGVDAVQSGWNPNLVTMVKTTDPATRLKMQEMISRRRQIESNLSAEQQVGRPLQVAGEDLAKRYDFMRNQSIEAGKRNRELVNSKEFQNAPFDTRVIDQRLGEIFDDLRIDFKRDATGNPVIVDGVPQLNFKNSIIEVDPTAQNVLKNLMTIMSNKRPTMGEAHVLKRKIDAMVNYEQTQSAMGKITTEAETAAKKMRATVNEALREKYPEYARNNDIQSGFMDVEGDLRRGVGKNTFEKLQMGRGEAAAGDRIGRLLSNVTSREHLMDGIQGLTRMSEELGGKFDVDLWKLAQLDTALEAQLGSVAKTGFKGSTEAAGARVPLSRGEQVAAAAESIDTLIKKAKGIDPSVMGKLDALERLTLRGL